MLLEGGSLRFGLLDDGLQFFGLGGLFLSELELLLALYILGDPFKFVEFPAGDVAFGGFRVVESARHFACGSGELDAFTHVAGCGVVGFLAELSDDGLEEVVEFEVLLSDFNALRVLVETLFEGTRAFAAESISNHSRKHSFVHASIGLKAEVVSTIVDEIKRSAVVVHAKR